MPQGEYTPPHVRRRRIERAVRLRELGFDSYLAYLRSPHWARVKARYRASDLPQECMCGETEVDLHHCTYERVGAERLDDLRPLCRRCHNAVHVLERRGDVGLDLAGLYDRARAARNRAEAQRTAVERADERREMWVAIAALPHDERLRLAIEYARSRHVDISRVVRMYKVMLSTGRKQSTLERQLRNVEECAYGRSAAPPPSRRSRHRLDDLYRSDRPVGAAR